MATDVIVALVTAPSSDKAAELARALVEEGLAACGNILPGVRSIYRWEGKVSDDQEVLLVLKSTKDRFAALKERVVALHPYDVPEVLSLDVADGQAAYLDWVRQSVIPK